MRQFYWSSGLDIPEDYDGLASQFVLDHIELHSKEKKVAYENILWALINTKEFVFNR